MLFSDEDYPAAAQKKGEEGTVQVELTVGTDGRVTGCKILRSSNSANLDTATCKILTLRARFTPARDSKGRPVVDKYITPPITWRLAEEESPPSPMEQIEPGHFVCSTPADQFAMQELVALKPGQEMRLAFQLIEEHPSEQVPVMAAVYFIGPNGQSRIAIGKARDDPGKMAVWVSTPGKPDDIIRQFPVGKDWIPLNLTLDADGVLNVRSGGLSKRYQWAPASSTFLLCNSGDWEISVAPQSYVPPPPAAPAN
jgi:TonB family protein